jgi:hypothetical protein
LNCQCTELLKARKENLRECSKSFSNADSMLTHQRWWRNWVQLSGSKRFLSSPVTIWKNQKQSFVSLWLDV